MKSKRVFLLAISIVLSLNQFNLNPAVAESNSADYKAALKQMRIKKDEVKGITWYQDKSSPRYINYNGFYLYTGYAKGYAPTLRLKIQYSGDDWLFINQFFFNIDGAKFEINTSYSEMQRDNDSEVWEWLDKVVENEELVIVKKIIKSKKAVMRMEGDKYYKDVTITSTQKRALKRVLTVYEGLKKK